VRGPEYLVVNRAERTPVPLGGLTSGRSGHVGGWLRSFRADEGPAGFYRRSRHGAHHRSRAVHGGPVDPSSPTRLAGREFIGMER